MKKVLFLSVLFLLAGMTAFAEGIAVLQPAGGEAWPVGSVQVIQWKFVAEGSAPVTIMLFKDGVPVGKIAEDVPCKINGEGSFKWQVGSLLPSSKIVVEQPRVAKPGKGYVIGVKVWNTLINGESRAFVIQ